MHHQRSLLENATNSLSIDFNPTNVNNVSTSVSTDDLIAHFRQSVACMSMSNQSVDPNLLTALFNQLVAVAAFRQTNEQQSVVTDPITRLLQFVGMVNGLVTQLNTINRDKLPDTILERLLERQISVDRVKEVNALVRVRLTNGQTIDLPFADLIASQQVQITMPKTTTAQVPPSIVLNVRSNSVEQPSTIPSPVAKIEPGSSNCSEAFNHLTSSALYLKGVNQSQPTKSFYLTVERRPEPSQLSSMSTSVSRRKRSKPCKIVSLEVVGKEETLVEERQSPLEMTNAEVTSQCLKDCLKITSPSLDSGALDLSQNGLSSSSSLTPTSSKEGSSAESTPLKGLKDCVQDQLISSSSTPKRRRRVQPNQGGCSFRNQNRLFICNLCLAKYRTLQELDRHTKHIHDKYRCHICPSGFTQRSNLQRHALKHVGFKPFVCNLCQKSYNRKDHLMRHMEMLHSTVDPLQNITVLLTSSQSLNYLIEQRQRQFRSSQPSTSRAEQVSTPNIIELPSQPSSPHDAAQMPEGGSPQNVVQMPSPQPAYAAVPNEQVNLSQIESNLSSIVLNGYSLMEVENNDDRSACQSDGSPASDKAADSEANPTNQPM